MKYKYMYIFRVFGTTSNKIMVKTKCNKKHIFVISKINLEIELSANITINSVNCMYQYIIIVVFKTKKFNIEFNVLYISKL